MARKFLNHIDLAKNELQNALVHKLAAAPGSPVAGQIYYNTTSNRWFYYNGSAFVNLATDSDLLQGNAGSFYLARANHTGTQLAATISDFDTQVRTSRLDQMAAPTAAVSLNSQKITNLATPTAATDAATKAYVDSTATGLDVKGSVRVASTANVSVTYNATGGASGRGQITAAPNTLDGVSLAANDRILLKDQTTGAQNGIWVVTTLGTGANGVWDRASDFDTDAEVTAGAFTFVEEGTTNADSGWVLTTNNPITIGGSSGTALVWAQFSGAGQITAGAALSKTGNTLDVVAGLGISLTTPTADAVNIDTSVVVRKFAQDFGDGAAVAYVITHNLNTRDVTVTIYDNTTPWAELVADVEHTSVNTITIRTVVAPTSNQYRVVIHG
jgi:hypothetical protein